MTELGARETLSRTPLGPRVVDDSEPELSLRDIRRVLVANWKIIALLAAIGTIVALTLVLLTKRTYTSTASFYPETRRGSGGLSSLAQQYGVSLPGMGSDPGQSLQFYVELARSREILNRLLAEPLTYRGPRGEVSQPLTEILEIPEGTPAERIEDGVVRLRSMIRPGASLTTGIVRVQVTTRSPTLSHALAQRTLDLINEFNLQKRQSQGATERRFAERRLEEMTDSLRIAEERLQAFEQRNAQYLMSPHLRMEQRRLANNLAAKQLLHTTISQSYEQARMEEVRDTPVITTLERPSIPVRPDSRRGLQKLMLGFIVGLTIGIIYAFTRSHFEFWKSSHA